MITGDLDRVLATPISSAGSWRPGPPAASGRRPGTYATTVAFQLASRGGGDPAPIAASLAGRLHQLDWVESARVTGGGYVTVAVTAAALAQLAVRVARAGPACAGSVALARATLTAPAVIDLAAAPGWEQARQHLVAALAGRLAQAAGAQVHWTHGAKRIAAPDRPASDPAGPVADAIAFAGADAVTYALARLAPQRPAQVDAHLAAAHQLANPAYAVRYAHAHAASALRQAGQAGLGRPDPAGFQPRLLAHPSELALLDGLSWLPERVAVAARRRRPDVLARFLEKLAGAYLECQQNCPAVRPGDAPQDEPGGAWQQEWSDGVRSPGRAGPASQPAAVRLWLVAAARAALGAGLCLLGVDPPDRL